MQSKLSKLHTKALSLIHRAWPENLGYERNGCNLCVLCSELGVQLASQRGQEWPHRELLNLLPGQNLDDFTVPLCSSNGRQMPAVKAAQGDSQWVLKSEVNYHQEICTKYCIATYQWLSAGEHSPNYFGLWNSLRPPSHTSHTGNFTLLLASARAAIKQQVAWSVGGSHQRQLSIISHNWIIAVRRYDP